MQVADRRMVGINVFVGVEVATELTLPKDEKLYGIHKTDTGNPAEN